MRVYENDLRANLDWALHQAGCYFEQRGLVHETLRQITHCLEARGVEYAVTDGLAMFVNGFRQFTSHVTLTTPGLSAVELVARIADARFQFWDIVGAALKDEL
ncbi:MAG: hypothetical protein H7Z14_19645 [Anaerolineae bacterium]|nr:hypothetical protein [Phycisphaerae bacterium]